MTDKTPPFHGSYLPQQVQFLLKPISVETVADTAHKEALIQSGRRHYSEMLSPEAPPSPQYLALFQAALARNGRRMAADCLQLAALIAARRDVPVLVSLARAGTPVGVMLQHILSRHYRRAVPHYSLSIIRDRGIDANALRHILNQGHDSRSLVFIDGWTGKGVISRELHRFVAEFNRRYGTAIDSGLYVLSDLAGTAGTAAACDDYLIPSAILNACVSGLVSRSVLNDAIGEKDFHGCVYYREFEPFDLSQSFIRELTAHSDPMQENGLPAARPADTAAAADTSRRYLADAKARYGIADENLIKPGIGEATRVLLRRRPGLLIVRDAACADTTHLLQLAAEKNVPVEEQPDLPYRAVSLIRQL